MCFYPCDENRISNIGQTTPLIVTPAYTSDFFSSLLLLGRVSARYDWLNHVVAANSLMERADSPLQPIQSTADSIRHPRCVHEHLSLAEEDDGIKFTAYDEDGLDEPISLNAHDVELYELSLLNFGKWLRSLLKLPPKTAPICYENGEQISFTLAIADVHVSLAASPASLKQHLQNCNKDKHTVLLLMSGWWQQASHIHGITQEFPHLSLYSIQDFITPNARGTRYEYSESTPFVELVKNPYPDIPSATFLKRPKDRSWEHLRLVIKTRSHSEIINVGDDVLYAWYVDDNGNLCGERKVQPVRLISKFCRGKKCTNVYKLFKSYAYLQGSESSQHGMNTALANTTRNHLRNALRNMFGYGEHEEPIHTLDSKKGIFEAAFGIEFSDSRSDPIGENRRVSMAPPSRRLPL